MANEEIVFDKTGTLTEDKIVLEKYLDNPNSEIRLMAAKDVLTRLDEDKDSFANARGVRNYFEKVLVNQANRLVKLNKEEITNEVLQKLTIEDVNC